MPRAMGRVTPIHKKSSHVTLILEESDKKVNLRYNITAPKKDKKTEKKKGSAKKIISPRSTDKKQESVDKKPGFLQRVFRRKAI
jgi:hypothetical protein